MNSFLDPATSRRRRNGKAATISKTSSRNTIRIANARRSEAPSRLKEPIARARQPEVLAQGRALVFAPEQAAPLQLGDDAVHEVVETGRQIGEHHGEAVAAVDGEPLLHLVGDRCG